MSVKVKATHGVVYIAVKVSGWSFTDMLRRDSCCPADEPEANKLRNTLDDGKMQWVIFRRFVLAKCDPKPSVERWRSFGCECIPEVYATAEDARTGIERWGGRLTMTLIPEAQELSDANIIGRARVIGIVRRVEYKPNPPGGPEGESAHVTFVFVGVIGSFEDGEWVTGFVPHGYKAEDGWEWGHYFGRGVEAHRTAMQDFSARAARGY